MRAWERICALMYNGPASSTRSVLLQFRAPVDYCPKLCSTRRVLLQFRTPVDYWPKLPTTTRPQQVKYNGPESGPSFGCLSRPLCAAYRQCTLLLCTSNCCAYSAHNKHNKLRPKLKSHEPRTTNIINFAQN